jgi:hypothetical protein
MCRFASLFLLQRLKGSMSGDARVWSLKLVSFLVALRTYQHPFTVFSVFPSDVQAKPHTHIKLKCAQGIRILQNPLFVCVCACVCVRIFLEPSELRKIVGGLKYMRFSLQCFRKTFFVSKTFNELRSSCSYEPCVFMRKVLIILRF